MIDDSSVIEKIIRHLGLWADPRATERSPPAEEITREPFYDDLPCGDDEFAAA